VITVTEASQIWGVERSAVIKWLRAALPYAKGGDWKTGQGFELYCHWVFDWIALTAIAADAGREEQAATELMLPYR
jgi:hypothetical protein